MKLICIGDSNTWGYDPRSLFGSRYPSSVRWTARVGDAGYEVVNYGENGACIPCGSSVNRILDCIRAELPAEQIILMLGSNDLLTGSHAEETGNRMKLLIDAIRKVFHGDILLVSPVPFTEGEWVSGSTVIEESRHLSDCYRRIANQTGIQFADAGTWNVELTFDGVHFSERGHAAFAEGLRKRLAAGGNSESGSCEKQS